MAPGTALEIGLCLTLLHHLCYRAGFVCSGSNCLGVDRVIPQNVENDRALLLGIERGYPRRLDTRPFSECVTLRPCRI